MKKIKYVGLENILEGYKIVGEDIHKIMGTVPKQKVLWLTYVENNPINVPDFAEFYAECIKILKIKEENQVERLRSSQKTINELITDFIKHEELHKNKKGLWKKSGIPVDSKEILTLLSFFTTTHNQNILTVNRKKVTKPWNVHFVKNHFTENFDQVNNNQVENSVGFVFLSEKDMENRSSIPQGFKPITVNKLYRSFQNYYKMFCVHDSWNDYSFENFKFKLLAKNFYTRTRNGNGNQPICYYIRGNLNLFNL